MTTVGDIMTSSLFSIEPTTTVAEAATVMGERRIGSALVMEGERLAGIFTERDIVRALGEHFDAAGHPVSDWMTADPVTVPPSTPAQEALGTMLARGGLLQCVPHRLEHLARVVRGLGLPAAHGPAQGGCGDVRRLLEQLPVDLPGHRSSSFTSFGRNLLSPLRCHPPTRSDERVGLGRPPRSWPVGTRRKLLVDQRLDHLPGALHRFLADEHGLVAVHRLKEEVLVGLDELEPTERLAEVEVQRGHVELD